MDPADVRSALQGQGLCGEISAQPGDDGEPQACLFPLNHGGRHGWEPDESLMVNQALLGIAVQCASALAETLPVLRAHSAEMDERVHEHVETAHEAAPEELMTPALLAQQVLVDAESAYGVAREVLREHLPEADELPQPDPKTVEERRREREAATEERRRQREESKRHGVIP